MADLRIQDTYVSAKSNVGRLYYIHVLTGDKKSYYSEKNC